MKPEIVTDRGEEFVTMKGSRGQTSLVPRNVFVRMSDSRVFLSANGLNGPLMPPGYAEEKTMLDFWITERGLPETLVVEIGGGQ